MDESNTTKAASVRQCRDTAATSDVGLNSELPGHRSALFSRRDGRPNRGIAMIWVAIFLLLIVLIVGLGLDSAKAFLVAHQLQNAADAAALAGACVVKVDPIDARLTAIEVAYENFADANEVELVDNPSNLPDGDVVLGWYSRMFRKFVPASENLNAVKVVARRTDISPGGPIPLNFGAIAGVGDVGITRYAIAMTHGGTGAGVIALSPGVPRDPSAPDETGLRISAGTLDVNDGIIQVNSYDDIAVRLDGKSTGLFADELNLCGSIRPGAVDLSLVDFPIDDDAPALPDPLCPNPEACTPPPTWDPALDLGTVKHTEGTLPPLKPGYYSGGFNITGGNVTLEPGIYILGGDGLVIKGNANFCAKGVMFYITGTGEVDLGGSGPKDEDCYIRVTPPDPESTDFCGDFSYPAGFDFASYAGISIFQDRENDNPARIRGGRLLDLEGTLYFPRAHVDLAGNGDGFGNQLIAWTIAISGEKGNITINYRGNEPSPERKSFLVE